MQKVTIWHNPRCSKSRETLALLQQRDIEPQIVEYLKDPPSPAEIERILKLLGTGARGLIRDNEDAYKSARADDPSLSEKQLVQIMHGHPVLIQRPVVIVGDKARIGRPPEAVLEILL
ncbi:MAG TPA: arsenate reductase (glutaredoxin) [Gammaproteobacteria bacterium]|jgi:arsenate reductase|nr:arsenate reductase (glutaredoxin) [Gammaproteobacteria bacterium]